MIHVRGHKQKTDYRITRVICKDKMCKKVNNKIMYIGRKFVYANEYSSQCIYEEAVFSSREKAEKYIKTISEEDSDDFLSEIVSYPIDREDAFEDEERWYFDRQGNPIYNCHSTNPTEKECFEETVFADFVLGDIVFIKSFPWNTKTGLTRNTIGVISFCPEPLADWQRKGGTKEDWDNLYRVTFIDSYGEFNHIHIEYSGISLFEIPLPDELLLLKILSEHLKGSSLINDSVLKQIVDSRNVKFNSMVMNLIKSSK